MVEPHDSDTSRPDGLDDTRPWDVMAEQSMAHRRGLVALRRPVRWVVLAGAVLGVVLVAVSVLLLMRRDVTEVLVAPTPLPDADLRAELSVTSVDPQAGEARLRLLPVVLDEDRVQGGLVRDGFRILVNDIGGEGTHTFEPGQPVQAVEFSVALTGSSAYRYPFDRYDAAVVVLGIDGLGPEGEALVTELSVVSSVIAFDLSAEVVPEDACAFTGRGCIALRVARPVSTVGYAVWFVVLAWGLALAGVGVLYLIARRGVLLPWWVISYQVGVLFALPPLRASLPGSPPPGGFVDFVSFYWAVAVVGLTLLALVWLWIREARRPPP